MKKLESSLLNMVVVLTSISVIFGAILAWVNLVTEGPIKEIKEKTLADGIKNVILGTTEGELKVAEPQIVDVNGVSYTVYNTTDAQGQALGTAVESTTNGFGGALKVLVGFDAEGNIKGYQVLETSETPGLGAKAADWFQKGSKGDIIGKNPGTNNLTVSKDGGEVDAITASTITSRAFLLAVNNAYNAYKGNATDAQSGATKQAEAKPCCKDGGCSGECSGKCDGQCAEKCSEACASDSCKSNGCKKCANGEPCEKCKKANK